MKLWKLAVVLATGGATVSCASKPDAQPAASASGGGMAAVSTASGAKGSAKGSDVVVPPKDAQWTIYCLTLTGVDHVQQAKRLKDQLVAGTNMKAWYVIHGAADSTLYYGFYRSVNDPKDPKESARAQQDKRMVAAMTDRSGDHLFSYCPFQPLSAPDPDAPPEWDLRNAKGYWSVCIAAYKDSPQRKQAAVETVRQARAQGVEAYFFHGDTVSTVCVGTWPQESVAVPEEQVSTDPDAQILATNMPRPQGMPQDVQTADGHIHIIDTPAATIVDPSLQAMMQKYAEFSVNGETMVHKTADPQKGQEKVVADPSYLVKIQEARGQEVAGSMIGGGSDSAMPADSGTMAPARTGTGQPVNVGRADGTGSTRAPAAAPPAARPAQPGYGRWRLLGG